MAARSSPSSTLFGTSTELSCASDLLDYSNSMLLPEAHLTIPALRWSANLTLPDYGRLWAVQPAEASLKIIVLNFVRGERQGAAVRFRGLLAAIEPSQNVGASRMEQIIPIQLSR